MKTLLSILLFLSTSLFSHFLFADAVEVDVTLSPAGSFVAKTNDLTGNATITGTGVEAKDIKVNLKSLKTGVSLRDTHTLKHLETEKYPDAVLIKAIGKDGKGKAKIKFRGQEKVVDGTYTISKDKKILNASFPLTLSEFKITGIKYMGIGVKDQVKIRLQIPIK